MAEREIPVRELRNDVSRILREVQAGESFTVTSHGEPVARVVPAPQTWVPGEVLAEIIRRTPVDAEAFLRDIDEFEDDEIGPDGQ